MLYQFSRLVVHFENCIRSSEVVKSELGGETLSFFELALTPNYRFVCPQLAESTNLAEVHQKHNGFQMALRSESQNLEPPKYPKAVMFQKVHWSGQVPLKLAKRYLGT